MKQTLDLLIRIYGAKQTVEALPVYPVEAIVGDGSFYNGGQLQLNPTELNSNLSDPEKYGTQLFKQLFSGPILEAYHQVQGQLTGRKEVGQLRVRLWVDSQAAELHTIRWERLVDETTRQSVPIALNSRTPFSRYLGLEKAETPPLTIRPVRVLIAVANPEGLARYNLAPIDVNQEIKNLFFTLHEDKYARGLQLAVTVMPGYGGISATLQKKLRNAGWYIDEGATSLAGLTTNLHDHHLVHFIGHGRFRRRGTSQGVGEAALLLENETDGSLELVKDEAIADAVATIDKPPHLMLLMACQSAVTNAKTEHPFVGLAPKLVQGGISAVIAMQDSVSIKAARKLSQRFMLELQRHGMIDRAVNQARHHLRAAKIDEWDIPVLFMRTMTGQLLVNDPVMAALEMMHHHKDYYFFAPQSQQYLPMPIDVIHLTDKQDLYSLEWSKIQLTAAMDIVKAVKSIFNQPRLSLESAPPETPIHKPRLMVIIGRYGSNKSTQLKHIVWHTINDSISASLDQQIVLPIYVDLVNYPNARATVGSQLEHLIYESLHPFWTSLKPTDLPNLFQETSRFRLRLIFDGSDDLTEHDRFTAWKQLITLMERYPHHDYLFVMDSASYNTEPIPDNLDLHMLVICPIASRKIRYFLNTLPNPIIGKTLLHYIESAQLFDLAETPWFLLQMIKQAKEGTYPQSRTHMLEQLVNDAIATIPTRQGMRAHVQKTLNILAWTMHTSHKSTLPAQQVFGIMAEMRGNREYNLEHFFDRLTRANLLATVGETMVRFPYASVQSYCTAKYLMNLSSAEREEHIVNITATFGRLVRIRLWEEAFIFLSGFMARQATGVEQLIWMIVYGVNLLDTEHTFLVAKCIVESKQYQLDFQIEGALTWRLMNTTDSRLAQRIRAARTLGQLAGKRTIRSLIRVANRPIRRDLKNREDYDFSSMRFAATIALQRMMTYEAAQLQVQKTIASTLPQEATDKKPETVEAQVAQYDPLLHTVLIFWEQADVTALINILENGEDSSQQALAALALGDLQPQLEYVEAQRDQAQQIMDCLIDTFSARTLDLNTRWAVAQALAMLDTVIVTERVVLKFIRKRINFANIPEEKQQFYKCLIYLTGRIRCQDERVHTFLVEKCIKPFSVSRVCGSAIEALGLIGNKSDKKLLEIIATGYFKRLNPTYRLDVEDRRYLQRKAIEALASVGDRETLTILQRRYARWIPILQQSFYHTSEEIYWRLSHVLASQQQATIKE